MPELIYSGLKGEYQVSDPRPIAFGRNSVIFRAQDKALSDVIIKEFRDHPEDIDDFYRELSARQVLSHHNIVPILDYGISPEPTCTPFLVMPFCQFGSLQDLLDQADFIPWETAVSIIEQISLAIDFAHNHGFIHGDIKPSNVLFCGTSSHACLTDFGLAKTFPVKAPITRSGSENVAGTFIYLSPEQVEHSRQLPASDIYAIAIVAYQMFTGHLPFKTGLSPYGLLEAIVNGDTVNSSVYNQNLPKHISPVLRRGMSTNIGVRPRSAMQFVRLLKRDEASPRFSLVSSPKFWGSLESPQKIALIGAVVAAIATIIAAIINILPYVFAP